MPADSERFSEAMRRFDAANGEDPHHEIVDGVSYPKELLYAQRLTTWLERFAPEASEALRLATRSQHIRRWVIPRDHYPMDRRCYIVLGATPAKYHSRHAH